MAKEEKNEKYILPKTVNRKIEQKKKKKRNNLNANQLPFL